MLAKAIEKIQELANEKERCQVEEKVLFEQGYIHQGDILTSKKSYCSYTND